MINNTVRVRFPPSPTGYLHVGGARTALFNWLFARHHGGVLVLRIEDTDRDRSKPEHTEAILRSMRWLGLRWDEGPFFQSDGVERHRADAARLLSEDKAYRDFTTPEGLAAARKAAGKDFDRRWSRGEAEKTPHEEREARAEAGEPHAIRFRVPEGETVWNDLVHGKMRFQNAEMEDLVILRSDGSPTYNLAVVSDDVEQRVTHVIRGDDHLSNSPKQIQLYEALGRPIPHFGHVPIVLGPDGRRLSKRHGATSVEEYAAQGFLPEAMVNFLALLGWNPGDDTEFMPVDELIARFSMDRVLKKSGVFDLKKLDWLSGQHFNHASAERLEPELTRRLVDRGVVAETAFEGRADWYRSLIDLIKTRARTFEGLVEQALPFVCEEIGLEERAVEKHWMKQPAETCLRLKVLLERMEAVEWTAEALEGEIRGYAEELGVGVGQVIHPLRVAVTGREASPGIFDVLVFLGRDRASARLEHAIQLLEGAET
jgi:glutamyl-tRNA synthetase